MNVSGLNDDVVSIIASYLCTADTLSLSACSRTLYCVVQPLAFSKVKLFWPGQIPRLVAASTRLHWLRDLEITRGAFAFTRVDGKPSDGDFCYAHLMADILAGASNLVRLAIGRVDAFLAAEPRIAEAIIALPNLLRIELYEAGILSLHMMGRLLSTPSNMIITYPVNLHGPDSLLRYLRPLPCVQDMQLSFLPESTSAALTAQMDNTEKLWQWPAVRHLYLSYSNQISLSAFAQAFPNLQSLHLRSISPHSDSGEIKQWWPSLQRVCGYYTDLASWPPAYPIHWLIFEPSQVISRGEVVTGSLDVIQKTSPVVLSFDIFTGADSSFWTGLVAAGPRLRYLDFMLLDGPSTSYFFHFIATVPQLLRFSRFVCIRMLIVGNLEEHGDALLQSLLTIPFLRYVALGFGNISYNGALSIVFNGNVSWWRVAGAGAGAKREAERISSAFGDRIHHDLCTADFGSILAFDESHSAIPNI